MPHSQFQSCIDACVQCAQECEHCSVMCLQEEDVRSLAHCIRTDQDCAQMCWTAAAYMSRGSEFAMKLCELCAEVCDACGAECRAHEHLEHCRKCAEACERCAEECRRMAGVSV